MFKQVAGITMPVTVRARSTFRRLVTGAGSVVEPYYRLPPSRGEAYTDTVRIFLAGASGVIGQRLIPRLVQAGHIVGGLTRSHGKTELLRHLGAEPILCDVFDREALIQAVRDFKPDVMLNELTDLPDDAAQISQLANLNARIRTEGTQESDRGRAAKRVAENPGSKRGLAIT